jgi:hypothetical protein
MMEAIRTKPLADWLPPESARPLLAWSANQRDALAAALARALAGWREAWGLPESTHAVQCEEAASETVLREGWRSLGEAAWLLVPADANIALAQSLFGETTDSTPMAAAVAADCARDAEHRIAAVLDLAPDAGLPLAPAPGAGQPWSGAVQADLPDLPGCTLLVGPDAMRAWCQRAGVRHEGTEVRSARVPLCSATEAMGSRTVAVNVELAGCEIDLGTLQGLQVGDVVRLPHALDAPARVTGSDGQLLFDGFLVAQQGRKAIELAQRTTH